MYSDGDSDNLFSGSCHWLISAGLRWLLSTVASGSVRSAATSSLLKWSTTARGMMTLPLRGSHLLIEGYVCTLSCYLETCSVFMLILVLRLKFSCSFPQLLSPIYSGPMGQNTTTFQKTLFPVVFWHAVMFSEMLFWASGTLYPSNKFNLI